MIKKWNWNKIKCTVEEYDISTVGQFMLTLKKEYEELLEEDLWQIHGGKQF